MENSLLVMFHESRILHLWAALFLVELLQEVPIMTCSNANTPSVNTGYFKLSSVATTLRQQQLVLEISLMSVPPGCGPLLPVLIPVASFCCIITIWLLILMFEKD
ncbi:PREDICTED: uncharacterized protein LOC108525823 [Rhinopithecus bieti]|uniref:uncharacterized protein LOC108525823 n=1 Tax=Rhinopithecus bieti TaxID=61621 RepID=UPI00083C377E|nr:PREDICTED: uncharacterized protein LOC108525823 [Rhinopithecus bieti]